MVTQKSYNSTRETVPLFVFKMMLGELFSAGFQEIKVGTGPGGRDRCTNSVWVTPEIDGDDRWPAQWRIVEHYMGGGCGNPQNYQPCGKWTIPSYLEDTYHPTNYLSKIDENVAKEFESKI